MKHKNKQTKIHKLGILLEELLFTKYLEGCFSGSKTSTDGTNGTDSQDLEGTLGTTSKRDSYWKKEDANERRAWRLKHGFLLR